MAFTYDAAQLASNPTYQLRFLLRDTVEATHQLEDEELAWLTTKYHNVFLAAEAGADLILAKLDGGGGVTSKRVGDLSITYDRSYYVDMRARWRSMGLTHQQPFCGGIAVDEAKVLTTDTDWPRPAFAKGMHDDRSTPGEAEEA